MLVSSLLPLTVCRSSQVVFAWLFSEPENCLKAAQNRQESGVASRLPWPVVSSAGAAAGGGARLHPWEKDGWGSRSGMQAGCFLGGLLGLCCVRVVSERHEYFGAACDLVGKSRCG